MDWKVFDIIDNSDNYYMPKDRFEKIKMLLSKVNSNLFFGDEELYEYIETTKDTFRVKKSTVLLNIELIVTIKDCETEIEIVEG